MSNHDLEGSHAQPATKGDLRVWHIPQVPGKPFQVDVDSVEDAVRILDILADYDLFQLDERIKPDFCNAQGLEEFDGEEWFDWYDDETGEDDPRRYVEEFRDD